MTRQEIKSAVIDILTEHSAYYCTPRDDDTFDIVAGIGGLCVGIRCGCRGEEPVVGGIRCVTVTEDCLVAFAAWVPRVVTTEQTMRDFFLNHYWE